MDVEEQIIAEAQSLFDYLYDDVENIFLPPDLVSKIMDEDNDDWEDELREEMSPIEKRWFDLIDDIQNMVGDFLFNYGQDPFSPTKAENNG